MAVHLEFSVGKVRNVGKVVKLAKNTAKLHTLIAFWRETAYSRLHTLYQTTPHGFDFYFRFTSNDKSLFCNFPFENIPFEARERNVLFSQSSAKPTESIMMRAFKKCIEGLKWWQKTQKLEIQKEWRKSLLGGLYGGYF